MPQRFVRSPQPSGQSAPLPRPRAGAAPIGIPFIGYAAADRLPFAFVAAATIVPRG